MNEDIIRMAREAGVFIPVDFDGPALGPLQRFADLVRADQRERDAAIAGEVKPCASDDQWMQEYLWLRK